MVLNIFLFAACNFNEKKSADIAEKELKEANLISPNVVTIKTADYVFLEVPDTIPSGMTTLRVENQEIAQDHKEVAKE